MHQLWGWIKQLDRILRGSTTSMPALRGGRLDIPIGGLATVLGLLAMAHGFCVGWFALFNRPTGPSFAQLAATMVKMPMLFLLTLLVTFPSLYVFNALVGSRLTLRTLMQLLIAAMAVTVAVLASFGPIVAFFSLTTTNYPFMGLLNVLVCGVAGLLGLSFLLQTLHRLTVAMAPPPPPLAMPVQLGPAGGGLTPSPQAIAPAGPGAGPPADRAGQHDAADAALPTLEPAAAWPVTGVPVGTVQPHQPGALDRLEGHMLARHTRIVFRCWVVLFGLVGAQMSWVLRPFIGDPSLPFALFRPRGSNFFLAVWEAIQHLFGLGRAW